MEFFLFLFFLIIIKCSEKENLLNDNKRNLEEVQNEFDNITIYVNYDCLDLHEDNEEEKIIIDAINNARKTLEKLIRVQKLKSRLDLKKHLDSSFRKCLYQNDLNTENADLFIFIRPRSDFGDEPLDFATSEIFYHLDNNINSRPLIGGVICGFKYGYGGRNLEDKDSKYQAASTIFLHEFTHILGFNRTIFQTKNLIDHKQTKNRMNNNDYDKYFFIGDNALRIAKLYLFIGMKEYY